MIMADVVKVFLNTYVHLKLDRPIISILNRDASITLVDYVFELFQLQVIREY